MIRLFEWSENEVLEKKDGTKFAVIYMALEVAKGGSMLEYLINKGGFPEPVARFYFKQILAGLEYVHS